MAPLVAGSLATLMGSHLSGKSVAVTFDGIAGSVIYSADTQINLQVPAALGSKNSASLVVTVDGVSSTPMIIPLSPAWPAVFPHGVFNQDNRENTPSAAAKSGDILQIFATGIPKLATVSVQIGDRKNLVPLYADEAPTVPGCATDQRCGSCGRHGRTSRSDLRDYLRAAVLLSGLFDYGERLVGRRKRLPHTFWN